MQNKGKVQSWSRPAMSPIASCLGGIAAIILSLSKLVWAFRRRA